MCIIIQSLVSGDSVDKTESKQLKEKVEVLNARPIEETILMTEGTDLENIISLAVPNEASDSNNNIEEEENNLQKAVAIEIHVVTCSMNEGITDKKVRLTAYIINIFTLHQNYYCLERLWNFAN